MASGDTLAVFFPQDNEPPSTSFATFDARNGHPVLDFATGESAIFTGIMPRNYAGGGVTIAVHYAMSSATANAVAWETAFERIGDQQQDIDSDGFATAQSGGDVTVPATSGLVDVASTVHTDGAEMDSVAVGETFRLKLTRATPSGTDATGDAELAAVEIRET